jgi:hypothetical protein
MHDHHVKREEVRAKDKLHVLVSFWVSEEPPNFH